jgi:hypothetical protein
MPGNTADVSKPNAKVVRDFHNNADTDGSPKALHHTLGPGANQASPGNHSHDGGNSSELAKPAVGITLTGSRTTGDATWRNSITAALAALGATDSTT